MENSLAVTVFFQRYEQKYLLDTSQYHEFLKLLDGFTSVDEYGPSTIYSIYYDNDEFGIARNALKKSAYKEKLRLRSYGIPQSGEDTVYLELKKKLKGITYKQRVPMLFTGMKKHFDFRPDNCPENYIFSELDWFLNYYKPFPRFMICYDRLAFRGREDKSLRITFDTNIRWRASDLDFSRGSYGFPLLGENEYLMEIKVKNSIPLYLTAHLGRLKIYPFSFSKFRAAYESLMNERTVRYA
ncbi:MAG: polyphosphate polymerase domain-containing protein [Treponema sp.]|jgi:SPX domain protein involved in polyphosphate accumulation|nr:polyphosphate polymerase domain-containing protein [Treponema sp.]